MYKNSRNNIIYPLFLAVAVVAGVFIGMGAAHRKGGNQSPAAGRLASKGFADNKLVYALSLIDRMYVDSVNMDSLSDRALARVIEELDPHSVYIPAEDFAGANEALDGEFQGIGVVFNMATDTVIILNVIPGGPSAKAGVMERDRIITINDSLVAGQKINQNDIVKMLRGRRGSDVRLGLQRRGISELVPVTVTRDIIQVKSLDAAFMIRPGIGYIKLTAFAKNTTQEFLSALQRLRAEGMQGLVFDLRDNSGGFLDQAISLANEFLPANTMIVYTEDRYKRRVEEFSDGNGRYADLPLVIIVNEGSASSSEILAGAIQDNDRGTIVGRRTFGKGLVQQQIPFSDGSAIRLTIARYYTPTGRSIQKPYTAGSEDYNMDLYNRFVHNEFFSADSIKFADSLKYTTPRGRIVYGGGGIMPDVFVPLDTTGNSRYYTQVVGRNIIYGFTIEYSDRHSEALSRIRTVSQLDSLFNADKRLMGDFAGYAARKGVPLDPAGFVSSDLIEAQLKAYIGRNTPLEDSGFYYNIYNIDNAMIEAVKILQ